MKLFSLVTVMLGSSIGLRSFHLSFLLKADHFGLPVSCGSFYQAQSIILLAHQISFWRSPSWYEVQEHMWTITYFNKPFPSSLVPLFQSESKCETILMKMTLICLRMKLRAELIFIWKVSHLGSFWNRDTRELGNGLLHYWLQC